MSQRGEQVAENAVVEDRSLFSRISVGNIMDWLEREGSQRMLDIERTELPQHDEADEDT